MKKAKPGEPLGAEELPADETTVRPERLPLVLVAGGPDSLVSAAQHVCAAESPAIAVESCGALAVASTAAAMRPFALIVNQDVYAFDPEEFASLARDVGAELVVIKLPDAGSAFLEQALRPSLRAAFRRFRTETESGPVRH